MSTQRVSNNRRELRLRFRLILLVVVGHHGCDVLVPAERLDLVQANADFLAFPDRHRNGRMPEGVRPELDTGGCPSRPDDPEHGFEPPVTVFPAIPARLKRRSG